MPKTTSRARAEAHEALYLRVAAALEQITAIAARQPDAPVPGASRGIAEALLFDTRPFVGSRVSAPPGDGSLPAARSGRAPRWARGFPAAAATSAGLAAQLAQARAALDMWEAERSGWTGECYAWRLTRGNEMLPIQRLRAKAKAAALDPGRERAGRHLREMLIRRIDSRFGEGYEQGFEDARQGLDNRAGAFDFASRRAQLDAD